MAVLSGGRSWEEDSARGDAGGRGGGGAPGAELVGGEAAAEAVLGLEPLLGPHQLHRLFLHAKPLTHPSERRRCPQRQRNYTVTRSN